MLNGSMKEGGGGCEFYILFTKIRTENQTLVAIDNSEKYL